jgi:hypothetical protein
MGLTRPWQACPAKGVGKPEGLWTHWSTVEMQLKPG